MKRRARKPSQLSESLHRRLNAYALAASAAGVGVLALAQPAEARIVYTPAHVKFESTTYDLDLNHDGVTDFVFGLSSSCDTDRCLYLFSIYGPHHTGGNDVAFDGPHIYPLAQALPRGAVIGSKRRFVPVAGMAQATYRGGKLTERGHWINVTDRYLGLKFLINGETHYGWARLNVRVKYPFLIFATLTGYAYETIPNKKIIAGKTHGKDDATLGRLAQGASGVSREKK